MATSQTQRPPLPDGYPRYADPVDPADPAHAMSVLCALVHDCLIYVQKSLEIVNRHAHLSPSDIAAKFFEYRGELLTNCLVPDEPPASNPAERQLPIDYSVQHIFPNHELEQLHVFCTFLRLNLIQGSVTKEQYWNDVKNLISWLFRISACLSRVSASSPGLQVGSTLYWFLCHYEFRRGSTDASLHYALSIIKRAGVMAADLSSRIPSMAIPRPESLSGPRVPLTVSLELKIIMDILEGLRVLRQEPLMLRLQAPPVHFRMSDLRSKDLGLFSTLCTMRGEFSLYGAHLHAARDVVRGMMPGPSRVTFDSALKHVVLPLLADDMFRTGRFYTELMEGEQMEYMLRSMCRKRRTVLSVYQYVKAIAAKIA